MDKLKECPFCGDELEIVELRSHYNNLQFRGWHGSNTLCPLSNCILGQYGQKTAAIDYLNLRTRHPEKKEVDEKELHKLWAEVNNSCVYHGQNIGNRICRFIDLICSHFSAPSSKVVSVEELYSILSGFAYIKANVADDKNRWCLAQFLYDRLHDLMTREE
jgi:hypothetical protein